MKAKLIPFPASRVVRPAAAPPPAPEKPASAMTPQELYDTVWELLSQCQPADFPPPGKPKRQ